MFKYHVPMAIELTEIVYKSRSYVKEIIKKKTSLIEEKSLFTQSVAILTEKLYTCRVLLDDDIFLLLHEFKRLCQDITLRLDVFDRPENLRNGELYFSNETEIYLSTVFIRIDELYNEISNHFQQKYKY